MEERKWYDISADNGESWSCQWLTEKEAEEERTLGHIVVSDYADVYYGKI